MWGKHRSIGRGLICSWVMMLLMSLVDLANAGENASQALALGVNVSRLASPKPQVRSGFSQEGFELRPGVLYAMTGTYALVGQKAEVRRPGSMAECLLELGWKTILLHFRFY